MMSVMKSQPVALNPAEQQLLKTVTRTGAHPTHEDVAVRAGVCTDTPVKVSKAYAGGDVEATITRRKRATPQVGSPTRQISDAKNSKHPATIVRKPL